MEANLGYELFVQDTKAWWSILGVPWPPESHLGNLIYVRYTLGGKNQIKALQNQSVLLTAAVLKIWVDGTCLIQQLQIHIHFEDDHSKWHGQASLICFIFLRCIKICLNTDLPKSDTV